MRGWMKADCVESIPNLDGVVLRLLTETDRLAQLLPSFPEQLHENCSCLTTTEAAIKLACGDRPVPRREVADAMFECIHASALHVVSLARLGPDQHTWGAVAECGVWHSLMGCSIALLCAAGFGMHAGPPLGPDGRGYNYLGLAGAMCALHPPITYTSLMRYMVEKPELTYASSAQPPRHVRIHEFPGYTPIWVERPQWLAAILDTDIPEGRTLPSQLYFTPPDEDGVANR